VFAQVFLAALREIAATAARIVDKTIDEPEQAHLWRRSGVAEILLDSSAHDRRALHAGTRSGFLDRIYQMRR